MGRARVVAAMSGGVDSSVAAALLKEDGHDVVGISLRLPSYEGDDAAEAACCGVRGIQDARRVAAKLDIPFYVWDFRDEFRRTVIEDLCRAYAAGRTPNPCVVCNEQVKFGALLERARGLGAKALATGHYARMRLDQESDRAVVRTGKGADDQSYFLFSLTQDQLRHALFPVGELTKDEVRRLARERGLPVHDKPGSQDLCFLPRGGYREFLRARCPDAFRPGPIVHVSGRVLAEHDGIAAFTVGQRRGLGVAHTEPLYVVEIRANEDTVVVGEREHVLRTAIEVRNVNWISVAAPSKPLKAQVRIRYNHAGAEAELRPTDAGTVQVKFADPVEAPCPGQAAVFYNGDVVLGGGTIERSLN